MTSRYSTSPTEQQSQLDPRRFLYILHLPIRTIRIITDPVVDSIMFVLMRLAVPPLVSFGQSLSSILFQMLQAMVGHQGAMRGVKLTTNLVSALHYTLNLILTLSEVSSYR